MYGENGKAQTPPFTFLELIRIIFGAFKKIDRTNLSKKSVYDFFSPMMGKFFAGEIMSAALGGIYAESTKTIHFQSLFKTPFISKGTLASSGN
jgi:protoporphyrinogen oxidase